MGKVKEQLLEDMMIYPELYNNPFYDDYPLPLSQDDKDELENVKEDNRRDTL
tara:strand:+ start:506 stop:661 length:156 start_codon:yes stop_codon:yes gene_type:complete